MEVRYEGNADRAKFVDVLTNIQTGNVGFRVLSSVSLAYNRVIACWERIPYTT